MKYWQQLKNRWNEKAQLRGENERLQRDREIAVEALKDIALHASGAITRSVADQALRDLGFQPMIVDKRCPPDRIYFIQHSGIRPTEYVPFGFR